MYSSGLKKLGVSENNFVGDRAKWWFEGRMKVFERARLVEGRKKVFDGAKLEQNVKVMWRRSERLRGTMKVFVG